MAIMDIIVMYSVCVYVYIYIYIIQKTCTTDRLCVKASNLSCSAVTSNPPYRTKVG